MPNVPLIIRAQSLVSGLAFVVDGFQSHQHKLTTRTGGEPLEDGREVTDHAIAAPTQVVLAGTVSNLGGGGRPTAAFQAIERIHKASEPVRVITEWATYPEMLITRCEPISAGLGMRFEMELREILRVSSATEAAVPSGAMIGNATGRSGEVSRGRVPLGAGAFLSSE